METLIRYPGGDAELAAGYVSLSAGERLVLKTEVWGLSAYNVCKGMIPDQPTKKIGIKPDARAELGVLSIQSSAG